MYTNSIYPPNRFPSGKPPKALVEKITICKEVFDDLYERRQFTPPAGMEPGDVSKQLQKRIEYAQASGRLQKG